MEAFAILDGHNISPLQRFFDLFGGERG